MRQSIPRLRSVRFKDGGAELRVLRNEAAAFKGSIERDIARMLTEHPTLAGAAVVFWGADGSSAALIRVSPGSTIPSILVADFVRARLLAERIETWTREGVAEMLGLR